MTEVDEALKRCRSEQIAQLRALAGAYQLMRAQACTLFGDLDRMAKIIAAGKTIGVIK